MNSNSILQNNPDFDCFKAQLSEKDFADISKFIYAQFGIKMPPIKRVMLQGRLLKRIRELKMTSFTEYKEYLFSKEGQDKEILQFLNVVTTNKTDFFREPVHFNFLNDAVLPDEKIQKPGETFRIWSAGCSSGEEPYTISIVLNEFHKNNPAFRFDITATDISSQMLDIAVKGIYAASKIDGVPLEMKKKYFLKSKDPANQTIKVNRILQANLTLSYLNLMDNYSFPNEFDVIFCRNVLIYFDRETQEKVIRQICTQLKPGGYFFIGHSESISGMNLPLEHIKPTIFRKNN
ncbi:MAG: methyltransferase domain-containing protein [Cytophagaceae bacterium]|jgi:chemotaxis protein methyltransferase CheR|nr:methyltransferase domain-containing protein [Cytophagaceae bacterium]